MRTLPWVTGLLLLTFPLAGATDYMSEPLACDATLGCVGLGMCVEGVCRHDACDPAAVCQGRVDWTPRCALNETIDGKTCRSFLGLDFDAQRDLDAQGGHAHASLAAGLLLTNGSVDGRDLTNTWISHGAYVTASVMDVEVDQAYAGFYVGALHVAPPGGSAHEARNVGVDAYGAGQDASAFVHFYDVEPMGCTATVDGAFVGDLTCPRPRALMP